MEWRSAGWLVYSASVFIFPCTINSRRRFLLAPAYLGSPGEMAVKQVCVCVFVCFDILFMTVWIWYITLFMRCSYVFM